MAKLKINYLYILHFVSSHINAERTYYDYESNETQFSACQLTACHRRILRTLKTKNNIDISNFFFPNTQDYNIYFYEGFRLIIDIHT